MSAYLLPIVYTLFLWWFSTGVILFLNGLPRWTFKWTMLGTSFVLVMALIGLVARKRQCGIGRLQSLGTLGHQALQPVTVAGQFILGQLALVDDAPGRHEEHHPPHLVAQRLEAILPAAGSRRGGRAAGAWRCRCHRFISSPIAAISATARRAAPRCCR